MTMRMTRNLTLLLAATSLLATPLVAQAETGPDGLPLVFSQRPLTLSKDTLAIDAAFQVLQFPSVSFGGITVDVDPVISLVAGASYGIDQDFEVGATVLPLVLSPEADYGNPSLYGMYRFAKGSFQAAALLQAVLPVQDGSDFTLGLGVPLRLAINDASRLDIRPGVGLVFGDSTVANLSIPVEFSVNFNRPFFFMVRTGLTVPDMEFDFAAIPLGFGAGYTLGSGDTPVADLQLNFDMPSFLNPNSDGDAIVADLWTLTVGARIFLGF